MEILKGIGRFFYIVNPRETSYKAIPEVPDFVTQAIPYFITFMILEYVVQVLQGKRRTRINDGVTSISHGLFLTCSVVLGKGLETYVYIKIYDNWRIHELPWDSPITWYIAAIVTDLGFYWLHRGAHEINILWATHQVHHSSEEYNLSTALRQSGIQVIAAWIIYLPMAFFVPPPMYLIHQQFNLLYQFWIHTELIESLGPLEYILNTPKHHRIHHGSNRYCLDKNYAGVLIIWDRMFGTFQEEKPGEKIHYGLVEEFKSFNPLYGQFFYLAKVWNKSKEYTEFSDKLSAWFKGPGWTPGKPRLGDPMEVPEVPNREKFDIRISWHENTYVLVHFLIVIIGFSYIAKNAMVLNHLTVVSSIFAVLFSITSLGIVLEKRRIGIVLETIRNITGLIIVNKVSIASPLTYIATGAFGLSFIYLTLHLLFLLTSRKALTEKMK